MSETINNEGRESGWRKGLRDAMPAKERTAIPRVVMPQLDPAYRITCNEEVNQGLTAEQAVLEATRCLDCPQPTCVEGCPVNIAIPDFIKNIQRGEVLGAATQPEKARQKRRKPPRATAFASLSPDPVLPDFRLPALWLPWDLRWTFSKRFTKSAAC